MVACLEACCNINLCYVHNFNLIVYLPQHCTASTTMVHSCYGRDTKDAGAGLGASRQFRCRPMSFVDR